MNKLLKCRMRKNSQFGNSAFFLRIRERQFWLSTWKFTRFNFYFAFFWLWQRGKCTLWRSSHSVRIWVLFITLFISVPSEAGESTFTRRLLHVRYPVDLVLALNLGWQVPVRNRDYFRFRPIASEQSWNSSASQGKGRRTIKSEHFRIFMRFSTRQKHLLWESPSQASRQRVTP